MQKILVPLDGSAFAEQAVETARSIAARTGAGIEFVTVQQPAIPATRVSGAPPLDPRIDHELRQSLQSYLDRMIGAQKSRDGVTVEGRLREGAAAEEIVAHAKECGADLIAMTTHGRGGLERLWLGSVADRVIRSANVPVLLVRVNDGAKSAPIHFRSVVIGAAGADDDQVVAAAMDVAGQDGVEYRLVHVLPGSPMIPAVDPAVGPPPDEMAGVPHTADEHSERDAAEYLDRLAGPLLARGGMASTFVTRSDSPAAVIVDAAREAKADVIAVGTAARTALARFIIGSTADTVVRSALCSVLVCPPRRGRGEELRL
jgi:nucleotide-binding universal stress UspA family protein